MAIAQLCSIKSGKEKNERSIPCLLEKLKEKGISIEGATTIEAIWINNVTDPEEVIDLIME